MLMDQLRGRYEGLAFQHSTIGSMVATTVAFASLALGMADGALAAFLEQAAKRPPFNLPYSTMSEMASIHVVAGKAQAVINSATAVIGRHADEIDRRAVAGEDFMPWDKPEITMDLVHQIHQCLQMVDGLQLALGSSTVSLSNPIQRFVRDIHVLATHGTFRVDPMAEITGRDLFGLPPFAMMAAISSPPPGVTLPPGARPPGAPPDLPNDPSGATPPLEAAPALAPCLPDPSGGARGNPLPRPCGASGSAPASRLRSARKKMFAIHSAWALREALSHPGAPRPPGEPDRGHPYEQAGIRPSRREGGSRGGRRPPEGSRRSARRREARPRSG